ncbi:hypothetical protein MXB_5634 [Myxobolus squamalis]|nr:hypothetical protein MXB_5634 [Myxobolus squamalis]
MQEFDISLDVPFILTLANYADYISYLVVDNTDVSLFPKSIQDSDLEESKYLVKYFHLPPMKFNITFSTSSMNIKNKDIEIPGSKNNLSYYNLIKLLILHNPLIDVSRTPLLLPCLNIEHFDSLMTLNDILESSKSHYISSFKSNLFQLLFGLNAIGNPLASVSQFAHGMKSFFYEPYQGVVMTNSFKKGVLFGVKGLYSGTIGTAATALTSITETLGKGLASLTFDSNFEENRNQIMKTRKSHPVQGLKEGSIGLFKGFTDGVTGLFTSPVDAYKEKKDAAHELEKDLPVSLSNP